MGSVWVVLHVHRHGEDLWAFDNEADAEAKAGAIEAYDPSDCVDDIAVWRIPLTCRETDPTSEVRDESD